jgi:GcrA cell cycle regulator
MDMSATRMRWDTKRIEQMERAFAAGLSCSQIARELGVTRNAVLGKLHRLRLTRPQDVAAAAVAQRRAARLARPKARRQSAPKTTLAKTWLPKTWLPKRARLTIAEQQEMLAAAYQATQPGADEVPIHNGRGCTLLELCEAHCRWPIGSADAAAFAFCGNERVAGLPYCVGHARIAYRPAGRAR